MLQYYEFLDIGMFIEILQLKVELSNPLIRIILGWTNFPLNGMDN